MTKEPIAQAEVDLRQPCELLTEILSNREGGNCTMEGGNTMEDLRYAAAEAADAIGVLLGAELIRRAVALAAAARAAGRETS